MFLKKILKTNTFPVIIIAIVFILAIFIIPHGEFAVNDDWFYYSAVKEALVGNWQPNILVDPSLIWQTFLGYLVSLFFGFSFTALKYLTLALSFLALIFFYYIILEFSNKRIALFSTLLFFACPWFMSLSFSFMTDIPALSFSIISLYFLLKGWHEKKPYKTWLGFLFLGAAIFIRQSYVIVLLAYLLSAIFDIYQQEDKRKYIKRFIIHFVIPLLLLFKIYISIKANGLWPETFLGRHQVDGILLNFSLWPKSIFLAFSYLAILCSPLLIIYLSKKKKYFYGTFTITLFLILWFFGFSFPGNSSGNIINIYSFGANGKNLLLDGTPPLMFSQVAWLLIGLCSAYFVYYFLALWRSGLKEKVRNEETSRKLFLFFITSGFIFLFINFIGFDRYLLPALAISLIMFSGSLKELRPKFINWIILFVVLVFSIIGVRDYYLVADSKWKIANNLLDNQVSVKNIDGGAEWSLFNEYKRKNPEILPFYKPEWPWYITLLIPDNERIVIISYDSKKSGYKLISQNCPKTILNQTCLYVWHK